MGQCGGRPWAGDQAMPGPGRVPGGGGCTRAGPGGAHLLSSGLWCPPHCLGWAARTSATLPEAHGSPLCKAGSALTLSGGACPHPRASSWQHLELLREQCWVTAAPETRPVWSTATPLPWLPLSCWLLRTWPQPSTQRHHSVQPGLN